MAVFERKVGDMVARIVIMNDRDGISVTGEVFPFEDRFFSATFSVRRDSVAGIKGGRSATVGAFSGNSFELEKSDLMIKAAVEAQKLATYYNTLLDDLHSSKYKATMTSVIGRGSSREVLDALALTPLNTKAEDIEHTLKLLTGHLYHLGERVTSLEGVLTDGFYIQGGSNVTVAESLVNLCRHHPDFDTGIRAYIVSAHNLVAGLREKGALA